MTRSGHDDVIAHRLALADGRAINLAIGDDAGEIVFRVSAAVRRDRPEIGEQFLRRLQQVYSLIAGHRGAVFRDIAAFGRNIRIARPEDFLRHLHDELFIRARNAEDRVDHPQRIPERHFLHEITLAAQALHVVHMLLGKPGDPVFQLAQARRHEPALRQRAQLYVRGVIKVHQRAEQMRVAGHGFDPFLARNRAEIGPRAVDEDRVLALDLQNVGLFGDRPERPEPFRLRPVKRVFPPQPRIDIMDLFAGIKLRIDNLIINPAPLEACKNRRCAIFGHDLSPPKLVVLERLEDMTEGASSDGEASFSWRLRPEGSKPPKRRRKVPHHRRLLHDAQAF